MSKSRVLVQGTVDVPETGATGTPTPAPVKPAVAPTSSFVAPVTPTPATTPSVKQIAKGAKKKTVKPAKKKPAKPAKKKAVKSTVKSIAEKAKMSGVPYRPTSMYGMLFIAGMKKFVSRQETIEQISKKTGKKAEYAFQVLRDRNHPSNRGRSTIEVRTNKDGIEEFKTIALK
jgi:hypothetical protein